MKLNSFLRIVRARWKKAALIANQQTQGELVYIDHLDSNLGQHVDVPFIEQSGAFVVGSDLATVFLAMR